MKAVEYAVGGSELAVSNDHCEGRGLVGQRGRSRNSAGLHDEHNAVRIRLSVALVGNKAGSVNEWVCVTADALGDGEERGWRGWELIDGRCRPDGWWRAQIRKRRRRGTGSRSMNKEKCQDEEPHMRFF